MKTKITVFVLAVFVFCASPPASAERASVATAKATVTAAKVVGKAAVASGKAVARVVPCPWRGLKWVIAHA